MSKVTLTEGVFHVNVKTSSAVEENCWCRLQIVQFFSEKKMKKTNFGGVDTFCRKL